MAGRTLSMLSIGLVFGFGAGFLVAAGYGITLDGHDHGEGAAHHAGMDHGADHAPLALPDDAPPVSLTAEAIRAPGGTVTLHVTPEGFRFAPENADTPHRAGEGHAHAYLDGRKLGRVLGPWTDLGALPAGVLRVELNSNDHQPLTQNGAPLAVEVLLTD